jgi:hypothetical protein
VRVQEHQAFLMKPATKLPDAFDVSEVIPRKAKNLKAIGGCASIKLALLRADDQLGVSTSAQAVGKQEQLALAAAKLQARIDLSDAEWCVRAQCLPLPPA